MGRMVRYGPSLSQAHPEILLKQQVRDALRTSLYTPIATDHAERLRRIAVQNALATKSGHMSFVYKGEYYNFDTAEKPRIMPRLAPQFVEAVAEVLTEKRVILEEEQPYVMGYVIAALNASNRASDWLKLLPDTVHHVVKPLVAAAPPAAGLNSEQLAAIAAKNEKAIQLMKQRMAINLLLA